MSSSSASNNVNTTSNGKNGTLGGELTIDIRPLLEDVSQVMTKHISTILSGVVGEYTVYKETHDTIMNLPCVQRLNERILELEHQLNGGESGAGAPAMTAAPVGGGSSAGSCADISRLQSAIVELNRYIQVLESRISVPHPQSTETALLPRIQEDDDHDHDDSSQSRPPLQEESIRLEVHETGDDEKGEHDEDPEAAAAPAVADKSLRSSTETNRIIETTPDPMEEGEQEETDEDDLADDNDDNDEEELEVAEDETEPVIATTTGVEVTDEDGAVEEEEEDEEEEDEDAVEEEEDAVEEEEDAVEEEEEEDAVEEEAEDAVEEEEDEIEVSEIKINGATYFTTNPQNGIIYACVNDDVGDEVGIFKNGVALFSKNKSATK